MTFIFLAKEIRYGRIVMIVNKIPLDFSLSWLIFFYPFGYKLREAGYNRLRKVVNICWRIETRFPLVSKSDDVPNLNNALILILILRWGRRKFSGTCRKGEKGWMKKKLAKQFSFLIIIFVGVEKYWQYFLVELFLTCTACAFHKNKNFPTIKVARRK